MPLRKNPRGPFYAPCVQYPDIKHNHWFCHFCLEPHCVWFNQQSSRTPPLEMVQCGDLRVYSEGALRK